MREDNAAQHNPVRTNTDTYKLENLLSPLRVLERASCANQEVRALSFLGNIFLFPQVCQVLSRLERPSLGHNLQRPLRSCHHVRTQEHPTIRSLSDALAALEVFDPQLEGRLKPRSGSSINDDPVVFRSEFVVIVLASCDLFRLLVYAHVVMYWYLAVEPRQIIIVVRHISEDVIIIIDTVVRWRAARARGH